MDDGAGDGGAGGGGGAGDGAGGAGAGGAGDGGAAAAYYETFANAELKTSASIQRYKTVEELAAGYVNLEKRYGIDPNRRIDLPADPADEAGMRAVYEKLGAPKDVAGYGFKLEDGASDLDKALAEGYGATAHKLGLSVAQAQGLMAFMDGQVKADGERQTAAMQTRVAEGETTLKTEWEAAYEAKSREVEKLVEKYGDADLLAAIKGDGLKANPNLSKMLGKMLDRMAEPGAMPGLSGEAATGDRVLTPSQAKAAVGALEGDPVKGQALFNPNHAQHAAVVAERSRLLAMANPPRGA